MNEYIELIRITLFAIVIIMLIITATAYVQTHKLLNEISNKKADLWRNKASIGFIMEEMNQTTFFSCRDYLGYKMFTCRLFESGNWVCNNSKTYNSLEEIKCAGWIWEARVFEQDDSWEVVNETKVDCNTCYTHKNGVVTCTLLLCLHDR